MDFSLLLECEHILKTKLNQRGYLTFLYVKDNENELLATCLLSLSRFTK